MQKKIYDPIRKKEVEATPEEIIRQKVIYWLMNSLKVPSREIQVEYSIGPSAYVDILVSSVIEGKVQPLLLVETKAPKVPIDGYVFAQTERYMQILKPLWVMLTNGQEFFYFKKMSDESSIKYDTVEALPDYSSMIKS